MSAASLRGRGSAELSQGGCQRHFEFLWDRPRGMDRLPGCRVHWRGLADLDRAGGKGHTPGLRAADRSKAISTQYSAILAGEGLSNWRIEGVIAFGFARPPRLAASFISNEACDVRYWHRADIDELRENVRFRG